MASYTLKQIAEIARSMGLRTLGASLGYRARQSIRRGSRHRNWPRLAHPRGAANPGPRLSRQRPPELGGRRFHPVDEALGDLLSFQVDGQTVDLVCSNGVLRLELLAADLLRFRLRPAGLDGFTPLFSYALDPAADWPPVAFALDEEQDSVMLNTGHFTCQIDRSPCRLTFLDHGGRPLSQAADGLGFLGHGAYCTRRLEKDEAIYGLGERAFDLNLRGRVLELWNTDPAVYSPGDDPIHLCIPMLIALRQGSSYGLFFDNAGRGRFDLGHTMSDRLRYEAATGELCVYFFSGPTIPDILNRYTQLTGRMPLPPRWMLGYHQSRWSYFPESEVRELAAEFRQRRIPCDTIHLDIHYMDGYRIFTTDPERFPDLGRLVRDLKAEGFRLITIIDPGVKVEPGYSVHDSGVELDVFCTLPDATRFQGPVWPGNCYFPDFTDPRVRRWWGELNQPLLDTGVAGFWNDMNEPAIFGGQMPEDVLHSYEGLGTSHGEIHNVYGLQMARASAEGLGRLSPGERTPLISRSGYAGLQRYALVWTGDNQSTWSQLRLSVSMCLNLGLSGLAMCGPDVGGFSGNCDGELLTRWTQVGALMPFFRNHSALGTDRQEPWAFGEPYESICRRWIELRYKLLPYLYTTAWQASQSGLPIMRPLALTFPEDQRTYSLNDQFLLGDALLAAPVGQPGQRKREVILPGGQGYDFWTDRVHRGHVTADAPLERMPLFVRAGSVLPMGPVCQHTGECPPDALSLHVYPGSGESWLYEDDGHSLDYRSGDLRLTRFVCEVQRGRLTVHRHTEGPHVPGYSRFEITVHGQPDAPREVIADGQVLESTFDPGRGLVKVTIGSWKRLELARRER